MKLRICLLALCLSACGRDHNTGFDSGKVQGIPNGSWAATGPERHPLAGAWRSECLPSGSASMKIETRVFDDRTLMLHFYFGDKGCESPAFQQVYVIQALPVPVADNEWELAAGEGQVTDVVLAANSPQSAETMERQQSCGLRGWEVNRARSVFSSRCFAKGTGLGTYHLRRAQDPSRLQIRLPGAGLTAWLRIRS